MPPDTRALRERVRVRASTEGGAAFPRARRRVALAYPSAYAAGMSSLGYQWIGTRLADAGLGVERVFLPDDVEAHRRARLPPLSMETLSPLGEFPVIAVSIAYELELAGLVELLDLAGVPPLAKDRRPHHPRVLVGGPLTFSNPLPAAPFADAMLWGEADDVVGPAVLGWFDSGSFEHLRGLAGGWVQGDDLVPVARAEDATLPARSRLWSAEAALRSMFLVEGERGCHRACTFCVMRRQGDSGMRLVTPEALLDLVPATARRVGLVGAAISDHPRLPELVDALLASGREVGVSSLRADRVALKPGLAASLRRAGYATLTVASDAASQRLRRSMSKGTTEAHLLACAELAREHRYATLKVYMMLGVPGETDADIDELIAFTRRLAAIHPVALGIAPFVPKLNTPMVADPFAGIRVVEDRLRRLRAGLAGARAEIRPTSARWAWVEHRLAQGDERAGQAAVSAVRAGGSFAAWKAALADLPERPVLDRLPAASP